MLKLDLHKKILLNTGVAVSSLLIITVFILTNVIKDELSKEIKSDLRESEAVFDNYIKNRFNNLFLQARIAAESSNLKSVVATADIDHETVLSVLRDTHKTIQSDLLVITNSEGIVLARTDQPDKYQDNISNEYNIREALGGKESASVLVSGNKVYQVVALPIILNNVLEGVFKAGFLLDDEVAEEIKEMTGVEVAFVVNNKLIASSGDDKRNFEYLLAHYATILTEAQKPEGIKEPHSALLYSDRHIVIASPIGQRLNGAVALCVIQKSFTKAMRLYYKNLRHTFIFIMIVAVLISFFISSILAHSISNPILALSEAASNLAKGDFSKKVEVKSGDEIEILAQSFNRMSSELRSRHKELKQANEELARFSHLLEERVVERTKELKETQAQLIQSSKMSAIGQLAAGVAHEINNPLTGVLNNVQLIKINIQQRKDFNIADFKEVLDVVEESAVRCKNITSSLLDFAHIAEGKPHKLIFVNEVIEKTASLIERQMQLENIFIHKQLPGDLPPVLGDPQLLQQVIFDILSNAHWAVQEKSKQEGGLIAIKAFYEPKTESVIVSISDNGIGIPEESFNRIFEPFFTTKPVGEGTGLGLSIAYNIIKQHKGSIEVESRVNKGTTFKIRLPCAQK